MADPRNRRYDVLVVGGGPAGIGAAVAAGRAGRSVLLIESAPFLGGCLTMDISFNAFHSQEGRKILGGLPQELVDRLVALGGSLGHISCPGNTSRSITPVDPEIVKYVAQELVLESGANLLLHSRVTEAVMKEGSVCGVLIHSKSGTQEIRAGVVVDCTGDGDIAASAGAPFVKGREGDGAMQAVTLMFRLAHVDTDLMPEYFTERVTYATKPGKDKPTYLRSHGYFDKWLDIIAAEKVFDPPHHFAAVGSLRDGELKFNTTRIAGVDGTDTWDLTRAEVEGRRQVMRLHKFLKEHVPGFKNSAIISTGPFIGIRETRHILGGYLLTADDVLSGRDFPDNVARGGFPMDVHKPDGSGIYQRYNRSGKSYGIPYRILVPNAVDQLLVAGRCVSADHWAAASVRVMGQSMAMGQAAGTAAALSLQRNQTPRTLDTDYLRAELRRQGAILEESDSSEQFTDSDDSQMLLGEIER